MAPSTTITKESYEDFRQRNIASNRSLLLSLKLSGPGLTPSLIPKPALAESGKETDASTPKTTRKKTKKSSVDQVKAEEVNTEGGTRRRSGRILNLQNKINAKDCASDEEQDDDYEGSDCSDESDTKENRVYGRGQKRQASGWHPPREPKRPRGADPPKRKAKSLKKGLRPDPKVFGHQIGTQVGDWWDSRMMCSQAGVHAPPVSGIAGSEGVGCFSVALSGGYEDDVDLGYAFTFTGSGGRALSGTPNNPKNLRTAPQSSDQEFTAMNAALRLSCELKNPIRVIRGYKNHSPFAPEEGYRYDGLYQLEKCWREAGQSGFQVCKFAFVRLPNQPKIPVKEGREAEAEQMYRDMGFKIEDLPASPEKHQPWTQSLAKKRLQEQEESAEDGCSKPEDVNESTHEVGSLKVNRDENDSREAKLSPSPQNTCEPSRSGTDDEKET